MVIGRRFAWAHLPKTGGDATLAMLCSVPGLVQFADPADSQDKHMPFFGREPEVAGKLLVMNIRRLPSWALSGAQHKARHGLHPDYQPGPLERPEEITSRTDADDLLRWMTDHGRFSIDRWLRMESLQDDVLDLLGIWGRAPPRRRRRSGAWAASTRASTRTSWSSRPTRWAGCMSSIPNGPGWSAGCTAISCSTEPQRSIGAYSEGKAEPPKNQFSIA
jgi:hypothetical protein